MSKIESNKIIFKEISTNFHTHSIEKILLPYVARRNIKNIINDLLEIIAENPIHVIAQVQNKTTYRILLKNGIPSFEEFNYNSKLKEILLKNGLKQQDLINCTRLLNNVIFQEGSTQQPPWIPDGFTYYTGDLESGYVIRDSKKNEFTYCPILDQYISKYEISLSPENEARSIPMVRPKTHILQKDAQQIAKSFNPNYYSDLVDNDSWDIMCEFISSIIGKTLVYSDSTKIGVYTIGIETKGIITGSKPLCMVYNLDCLAGNHWCWTTTSHIVRGGAYNTHGCFCPMSYSFRIPDNQYGYPNVSFRIVLKNPKMKP